MNKKNEELPAKWAEAKKSIKASQRASQVAFELKGDTPDFIRGLAAKKRITPSDQIRTIIGLSVKAPKRPRMSISLSKEDYQQLGERYSINPKNKEKIHAKIKEEIESYHVEKEDD